MQNLKKQLTRFFTRDLNSAKNNRMLAEQWIHHRNHYAAVFHGDNP